MTLSYCALNGLWKGDTMKNTDQKFNELNTELSDQTTEFLVEMRKEFATFNADIKRIIRFHRFVIIGSLAALMTVFSVLTPLLN
ncbi:MAG: hypothetical protein NWQ68_02860 [Ilumatobacteraceae bacterium]|jgi:hypothetical protein|nr:hypothetical protein [Ilumatobacteraceae bacterium]